MKWKFLCTFLILFFLANVVSSQTVTTQDSLKSKIEERNNQIKKLEEEIKKYNTEVENANKEAKTLESTIKSLDLTKKKITTDINLTQNKISKTNLTIDVLNGEIKETLEKIENNKKAIGNAIKSTKFLDDNSLVALVLTKRSISEIWGEIEESNHVRDAIIDKTNELKVLKNQMDIKQNDLNLQKKDLTSLKQDLSGKKQAVEYTVKEKSNVLVQTKSKEQTFKQLVKTKEQEKAQFERELYEYESQLRYLIDPNSYPKPKSGIFEWPLDKVIITQKFGKTVGAEKLYASGSHNGVDFGASIGTKVKNVLDGTVLGTGNTDIYSGCYSFGKWVFVEHDNGLSTIYGHLSVISVEKGQKLKTGELIGFTGNTGYSTGPHLHISVYASQGVRIEKYVNSRGCKEATLPLADIRAYLDPLDYFPKY